MINLITVSFSLFFNLLFSFCFFPMIFLLISSSFLLFFPHHRAHKIFPYILSFFFHMKLIPAESIISAGISRNHPKRPEHPGMTRNLFRGGTRGITFRFTCWNGIFRPFRPERNGINKHIVKILAGKLIALHDPWLCKF